MKRCASGPRRLKKKWEDARKVEYRGEPDVSPMKTRGAGVNEIRIFHDLDKYRLMYAARFEEAIYVLHVFTKKKI
jgi:phage-related protein